MENEEDTSSVILNQTGPIQTDTSDLKGENLGSNSSLLLSKMNVEQDAVKQKSLLDVGVNKLSESDNSVTPFLNSPNNVSNKREAPSPTSSLTQVTSATNLTGLKAHAQVNGAAQNQSADKEIAAFLIYSPKSSNKVTFLLFILILRYPGLGFLFLFQ
jgi:hypothetical protein